MSRSNPPSAPRRSARARRTAPAAHGSRSVTLCSLLLLPALTSLTGRAGAAPTRAELDTRPQEVNGRLVLPAWETAWEKQRVRQKDTDAALNAFRRNHPELYGVTVAPIQPVRLYAETDPVDSIYYVWEVGTFDDFFGQLTHELLTRTSVTVTLLHHGAAERAAIEAAFAVHGDDPADASFIDVATLGDYYTWVSEWPYDRSLESFWTVDFGPYFVLDGAGTLGIMDPRYYPWRVNDDAVPTKLAALEGLTVWRPDLDWEGGNLFSDGQGTCFTTQVHLAENLPQTQAQVEAQLFEYFGCEKVIWLHVLHGEGTGHIDMFFKPASPTVLLLGEYDAGEDPVNAERLEWNATILGEATNAAGQPFEVRRFPMPRNDDDVWRSYSNGIVVNDLLLVPTYAQDRSQEAEALAIFGAAFPDHTVVPLDSDGIIEWGGAIHCVTRTRPSATRMAIQPTPEARCEGAYRCTTGCGDYDFTGDCWDGLSVYCEGTEVWVELCYYDERCGWDLAEDFMYCVSRGCGDLPAEGECRTSDEGVLAAVRCVDGYPLAVRCAEGEVCEIQGGTGQVGCGPPCEDDCVEGEGGCEDEGHRWSCGEAGDGDSCLERVVTVCEEDTRCEDASCIPLPVEEPKGKGCGCNAGGEGPLLFPLLALLLLGTLRRRRPTRAARKDRTP